MSRSPTCQGHAKIMAKLIIYFDLENKCRLYESNQNSLYKVIVFTSHSNLDLDFKVIQNFDLENIQHESNRHSLSEVIELAR